MEDHRREQEADPLRPAVDRATQPACLPREVEVEIKPQQVVEHIAGHPADRLLRDVCEDGVPDLLEEGGSYASDAVFLFLFSQFNASVFLKIMRVILLYIYIYIFGPGKRVE